MVRVVLLRHCESRVDPSRPASTWGLTERGAADAVRLAEHWSSLGVVAVAAGEEPKLVQTVTPLAEAAVVPLVIDVGFSESHGEGWFGDEEFLAMVGRFFAQPDVPPAQGWETADDAAHRWLSAADQFVGSPGTLVVCSGGRVLTAVLRTLGLVARDDLYTTWRAVRMPDAAVIDLPTDGRASLVSPFGATRLW